MSIVLQIFLSAVSGIAGESLILGFWLAIFFTAYSSIGRSFPLFEIDILGPADVDNPIKGFIVGVIYGIVPGLLTGLIIGLTGMESSAAAGLIGLLNGALPLLGLSLLSMLTRFDDLDSMIHDFRNNHLPEFFKIMRVLAVPAIAAGIVLARLIPVVLRHNS